MYVKVLNAPSGLTYASKVLPKEGSLATQTQVSAEQWLTVPKADSIKCTATSSYGTARSASVGLEEARSTVAGDYVTLTGYYGKAATTVSSVIASQTATIGVANSIKIYGTAKDSSGTYRVNTLIKGISGGKATFSRLSETSSAGTSTQVVQTEHAHGTFTSTASYTPTTGTAKTKTRTSNYGTEYDINMKAAKGSLPTGILGYYVKPGTIASKIQGAVNAAQSKDVINVAAGKYVENVQIDKSLTIKGAGKDKTIVDGNNKGSVFLAGKNNRNMNLVLSGMTIQSGSGTNILNSVSGGTYLCGGGVLNYDILTVIDSKISGNTAEAGGGIANFGTAIVTGSTIFGNIKKSSGWGGGGIYNKGTLTVQGGSIISGNKAEYANGGGIANEGTLTIKGGSSVSVNKACAGGGISNSGKMTVSGSTISGNTALQYSIYIYPGSYRWYGGIGGGIYNSGTATVTGCTISGNTAIGLGGGGIYNSGTATVTGSTISTNTATRMGGIYNVGTLLPVPFDWSQVHDNNP